MIKQKIKSKYLSFKRRIADLLQRKSEWLSLKSKKLLLVLFCLFFVSMSIVAVVKAITTKAAVISMQVNMPRIMQQKEMPAMPFISKKEFERIEGFKKQLYLLPKHSFDSFMLARPKLLDSITEIEQYYQSQK